MSPVRLSIATPVQPSIATPGSVATSIPIIAMPPHVTMPTPLSIAVYPNNAMPVCTLFPSPAMAMPQTAPLSGNTLTSNVQFPNFSNQLLLELGSLVPELENMLQAGTGATFQEQWSTPQWNFSGLVSNPFVATNLAANTANHPAVLSTGNAVCADASLHYFSMAAHYDAHNPAVGLSPPSLVPSPQSRSELPLLPPFPSDNNGMWMMILDTVVGRTTNVFRMPIRLWGPRKSCRWPW